MNFVLGIRRALVRTFSRFHIARIAATIAILVMAFSFTHRVCQAQDVSTSMTTGHDPNIFENYASTPDQMFQWNLNLSKDWDFDNMSLGASYDGTLQSYRDLPTRTFHVHVLSLNGLLTFGGNDMDENEPDSSDDTNSVQVPPVLLAPKPATAVPSANADSLLKMFRGSILGMTQVDREPFLVYDNSLIGAWLSYKQPITQWVSIQPAFSLSYHNYPNLAGLSNVENAFLVEVGTWTPFVDWASVRFHYGVKGYPYSTSYLEEFEKDSVIHINPPNGHGKGGRDSVIVLHKFQNYQFNSPSVGQMYWSFNLKSTLAAGTKAELGVDFFARPSTEARVLPNHLSDAVTQIGSYDDHYAYHGARLNATVQQSIGYGVTLNLNCAIEQKTFTSPAYDLNDSLVADLRLDHYFDGTITLSKVFSLTKGSAISPKVIYEYTRNSSNATYYDFEKNMISFGFDFSY